MSENENKPKLATVLPGEWTLERAFGPVLSEMGEDLKRHYIARRDGILEAGYKKIEDPNDGKRANPRVARDVMWNGAFSDSEICAEYFGGIMASSRSEDGKDDSAIQFVDVTKSLSSKQLGLHYVIYNRLNKLWVSSGTTVNVALGTEMDSHKVWFATLELGLRLGMNVDTDFNILHRHGLLSNYSLSQHIAGTKTLPYASATPTTFGVLLYASAHNAFDEWRQFDTVDFGDFDGIELPEYYCDNLEALSERAGLTSASNPGQPEAEEAAQE